MEKFKIPHVPQTTLKSIRFPNDMIEEIEDAIQGKECTFSAFVIEAVRIALLNLKEDSSQSGE
ncbi:YlcI/YnfO family protein [Anaeromassilibacillus sp. Marseille-P3371]|uniref:YlcI/YnfO family protein n=1 Tax=Anaeromassilibacillus sp. Marseille-P3371 TaxID=1944639 RepID=UPI000A1CEDFA|nr:YlcI/YnfO family protein [Anaeromassilibacillus sp. Marseille-P3371]